jgi:hypothetical protein
VRRFAAEAKALGHTRGLMTYNQYYRRALYVPLVLPICVWAFAHGVGPLLEQVGLVAAPHQGTTLEHWLVVAVVSLYYGGIVYFIPYLLVLALIWPRTPHWRVQHFRWALSVVPLSFSILTGAVALILAPPPDRLGAAWRFSLFAASIGGGQALLIGLGEVVGSRLGWLRQGTQLALDERVA